LKLFTWIVTGLLAVNAARGLKSGKKAKGGPKFVKIQVSLASYSIQHRLFTKYLAGKHLTCPLEHPNWSPPHISDHE
jgi:hypothetical protein